MICFVPSGGGRLGRQGELGRFCRERRRTESWRRGLAEKSMANGGLGRERETSSLPPLSSPHSLLFSFDSTHIGEIKLGVRGVGTAVGGHGGVAGSFGFSSFVLLFGGFVFLLPMRESEAFISLCFEGRRELSSFFLLSLGE